MQKKRSKIKKEDKFIELLNIRLDYTIIDYYCIVSNYSISNKLLFTCEIIDYLLACI